MSFTPKEVKKMANTKYNSKYTGEDVDKAVEAVKGVSGGGNRLEE